jgi:hypothetical protein
VSELPQKLLCLTLKPNRKIHLSLITSGSIGWFLSLIYTLSAADYGRRNAAAEEDKAMRILKINFHLIFSALFHVV